MQLRHRDKIRRAKESFIHEVKLRDSRIKQLENELSESKLQVEKVREPIKGFSSEGARGALRRAAGQGALPRVLLPLRVQDPHRPRKGGSAEGLQPLLGETSFSQQEVPSSSWPLGEAMPWNPLHNPQHHHLSPQK